MTDFGFGRRLSRRGFLGAALLTTVGGRALAQPQVERLVEPLTLPLDKPGVWTLHFRYKAPRITTVDMLDKGGKPTRKTVWYMWFQVYNRTEDPQTFFPEFELVTKDLNTSHLDNPDPYVVDQIKRFEDRTIGPERPNGELNLQTTISISKKPIPVSRELAVPRMVSGIAVWTDVAERAPNTNRFSVYVSGLSNGLATERTPDGQLLIRRKTLQINFFRPTDDVRSGPNDIRPDAANGAAETWIYRGSSKINPRAKPKDDK